MNNYNLGTDMSKVHACDVCGAQLDPEDYAIHLCKICQGIVIC